MADETSVKNEKTSHAILLTGSAAARQGRPKFRRISFPQAQTVATLPAIAVRLVRKDESGQR